MSNPQQRKAYAPHATLHNVQQGSVLLIPKHDNEERLKCNFAGTFCDLKCYLNSRGYNHPAVVIGIHGNARTEDHRMLPVTFIQMTSHPLEKFTTLPIEWSSNGKGQKATTLVLPHTYTLPLYRFKPFFGDPGVSCIVMPNVPLEKGLWLHFDTDSISWTQLVFVMDLVRSGRDIFRLSNYPENMNGPKTVARLQGTALWSLPMRDLPERCETERASISSLGGRSKNLRLPSLILSRKNDKTSAPNTLVRGWAPAMTSGPKASPAVAFEAQNSYHPMKTLSSMTKLPARLIKEDRKSRKKFLDAQNPFAVLDKEHDSEDSDDAIVKSASRE